MATYSFDSINVSISGPNGSFPIGGPDVGNTEGGISIEPVEDKNNMQIGAGGEVMHSLHSGKAATVTVRVQKVAPVNSQFDVQYNLDTSSGVNHGRNTITIRDITRGDSIVCQDVAYARLPALTFGKDGGEQVWVFHAGKVDTILGSGVLPQVA